MTAARWLFREDDLVELLVDEPELFALADALAACENERLRNRYSQPLVAPSHRRLLTARRGVASVAIVVGVAAAALLLVAPWRGEPSLTEKALAAVGDLPVLHVVVSEPEVFGGPVVDVNSGRTLARTLQTEVWFDQELGVKKTIWTLDGEVLDAELDTKHGRWTRSGPVYTCAWIAAHPAEATRAGVSCNASGINSTTPHVIAENPPDLDPALAGFVDQYRSALASGGAKKVGQGNVDGQQVIWLGFDANGSPEQVAVNADTYRPLLIKRADATGDTQVLTAVTEPVDQSMFTRPDRVSSQLGSSITAEENVTVERANAILGGHALWLGERWSGLTHVATTHQVRALRYPGAVQPSPVDVIDFVYASVGADGTVDKATRIDIYEAMTCVLSVGWNCSARDPSVDGTMELLGSKIALVRSNGVYVSVWNVGTSERALEVARALMPIRGNR